MKIQILVLNDRKVLERMGFHHELPYGSEYSYQKVTDEKGMPNFLLEIAKQMPDEIAEEFIFTGNPSQAIEYISRFSKSGATQICLLDILGLSFYGSLEVTRRTLDIFHEKVLPYFSRLRTRGSACSRDDRETSDAERFT